MSKKIIITSRATDQFLIFKGISFGFIVWFFAFSVAQLYKLQFLHRLDLGTVVVNYIAALIYGFGLGIALQFLYREPTKIFIKNQKR